MLSKGVTLIELIIGIAIVSLLLGLGLPSYSTWIQNSQIRTAAESIQNGLQLARAEAVSRNTPVQLTFNALPASTWTISVVASGVVIQQRSQNEGSANATVAITPAGTTSLTFNGLGRVTAPVGSVAISVDVPTTILAGEDSRNLRVALGVGGDVRMCDPNVTTTGDTRAC